MTRLEEIKKRIDEIDLDIYAIQCGTERLYSNKNGHQYKRMKALEEERTELYRQREFIINNTRT